MVQSFKILLVDDFEDFRRFVRSAQQQRTEFEITEASDGLQAVERAEKLDADLILLDIGLPRMNGFEVARRVRYLAPGAKILFVSQESSPDVVRKALSIGARGYIHKLRAGSDLLPAIEAVFRGEQFVSDGLIPALPSSLPSLSLSSAFSEVVATKVPVARHYHVDNA